MPKVISGPAFVVQHNIDTDQIIPAQIPRTHVPRTAWDEGLFHKLGAFARIGLPESIYHEKYRARNRAP